MQEAQVSADGVTRPLPRPFLVLATQNPVELEGTFPLPEAQLDRFLLRLSLGYPNEDDEEIMVGRGTAALSGDTLEAVATPEDVQQAIEECAKVRVHADVRRYLVQVARATRTDADVRLGASPRASLALYRASQAWAAMQGRDYVMPDDVKHLAAPVLAHRLIAALEARLRGRDAASIVTTNSITAFVHVLDALASFNSVTGKSRGVPKVVAHVLGTDGIGSNRRISLKSLN